MCLNLTYRWMTYGSQKWDMFYIQRYRSLMSGGISLCIFFKLMSQTSLVYFWGVGVRIRRCLTSIGNLIVEIRRSGKMASVYGIRALFWARGRFTLVSCVFTSCRMWTHVCCWLLKLKSSVWDDDMAESILQQKINNMSHYQFSKTPLMVQWISDL